MGLKLSPEAKMARKVIAKHSLVVPFNLDDLVSRYAKITYKQIPVDGVDGVCLNLKRPGKTPTVIVNSDSARTRQKFTLAHELGHIIIPWHLGNFIDDIDEDPVNPTTSYWELESEANRFASELLMPFDWIYTLYKENPDPDLLLHRICKECGVSEIAGRIRLGNAISEIENLLIPIELVLELYNENSNLAEVQKNIVERTKLHPKRVAIYMVQYLPGKIAFCVEKENIVLGCGSTRGTHAYYQSEGGEFFNDPYPLFKSYTVCSDDNLNTHWWILDGDFEIPEDDRSWRDILDKIVLEIDPFVGIPKFKATVNGKLSGVNGNWERKNPGLGVNFFIKDVIQRFNNPEFQDFINHKDFFAFIKKRSEEFFK